MKKFKATVVMEVIINAESKEFANELLKRDGLSKISVTGCSVDHGYYDLRSGKFHVSTITDVTK